MYNQTSYHQQQIPTLLLVLNQPAHVFLKSLHTVELQSKLSVQVCPDVNVIQPNAILEILVGAQKATSAD